MLRSFADSYIRCCLGLRYANMDVPENIESLRSIATPFWTLEVALFTPEERRLLEVRPGMTDFSSIVFSDEGEVLAGSEDPDLKYHQIIRPWKSRLGLLYIEKRTFFIDFRLICLTLVAIFSRKRALSSLERILARLGADEQLREVAARKKPLFPYPPPGADEIVKKRG